MAVLRNKDVKKLGERDLDKKLSELRLELTKERASIAIGASATSPGRIREIRRAIARILTEKSNSRNQQNKTSDEKKQAKTEETKEETKEKPAELRKDASPKNTVMKKGLAKGVEGKGK